MKYLLLTLFSFLTIACQQEEFTVVEAQEEESFLLDQQLTGLVQSVASHDGSYDDIIDSSPCFSIDFPYEVNFNGEVYTITSIADLAPFQEGDEVVPVFPISITSASYLESDIAGPDQFQQFIGRCAQGTMYNDRITCVDFVYPVSVSVYNPATSDFEVIDFQHDKQTFLTVQDMNPALIARIRYPLQLMMLDGTRLDIADNQDLKETIQSMIPLCD